ncbi:MAG: cellulase family glycosylhydrolase [Chloroflexota bacterium]|nr:cellulase family glycosylhydrolase [Chloroflexota bacterium]
MYDYVMPLRGAARTLGTTMVRLLTIATLVASPLFLLPTAPPATAAPATALGAGSRIPWQGGEWYLHGANIPWLNWGCDFGCNANGGASSTGSQGVLTEGFRRATDAGMNTMRWWVFPGDPWQITRDSAGAPNGLHPAVYADFDAALRLAEAHDLYYVFVVFSAPTSVPTQWVTDAGQRTQLAGALAPLFARYRGHPRVLAWEVFNEPEYDIWGGKIAQEPVQATVRAIADAVHASSTAYVTVGSAHLDGLSMWQGQGLDFYQAHWYDGMAGGGWCARCTDYAGVKARFGLDGPLVIGELYTGPETDALQRHEDFYAKGFAGAWPWSLFADRTNDKLAVDLMAAKTFAQRHGDLGPRSGATIPTPVPPIATTVPPTPVPSATATRVPDPTATTVPPTATTTPPATATRSPDPTTTPSKTPAPTSTAGPTVAPPAFPSATPVTPPGAGQPSFTTRADVSPSTIAGGHGVTMAVPVTSKIAGKWLIDVEVYSPTGQQVFQKTYDNQTFRANQTRRYSPTWRVPAGSPPGTYTVKVGVFGAGWGQLYGWNDAAGRFTVRS